MTKGNHVINNFENVIHKALKDVLAILGLSRELDAVSGSGGDVNDAAAKLNAKIPNAIRFYNEIKAHPVMAQIHAAQDDEEVEPNDPNSLAFGKKAGEFVDAAVKWAMGDEKVNMMDLWRQLVNLGYDKAAADNYVKKGSSAAGTPKSEPERKAHLQRLQEFVKGDLTKLAGNFLLAIRLDLKKSGAVDYETTPQDWKKKVRPDP